MAKTTHEMLQEIVGPIKCTTCVRPVESPYRRRNDHGAITEGCIADDHTGHLFGESLAWHMRPAAKKLRTDAKKRLRDILKSGKR